MIAPLSSSFENTRDNWFSLERIICFITHQPFAWESPYQRMAREEKIASTFNAIKEAFTPHANEIISMFSSKERVSKWILEYENYTDEQFRLKYPAFYEKYKLQKRSKN